LKPCTYYEKSMIVVGNVYKEELCLLLFMTMRVSSITNNHTNEKEISPFGRNDKV
jgi:hypothetical protein